MHSPAHLFNICAKNVIRLINVIKGQRTDFTALEISPNVLSFSQENNKLSAESNAHGTSFIAQVMAYRDLEKKKKSSCEQDFVIRTQDSDNTKQGLNSTT